MRICPNCGRTVAIADRFCGGCRYPLETVKQKKCFLDGIRADLVPAIGSCWFTMTGILLWVLLLRYFLRPYGILMVDSVTQAALYLAPFIIAVAILGAGFDLLLSGCFANSKWGTIFSAAGITLAFSLMAGVLWIFAPGLVDTKAPKPEIFLMVLYSFRGMLFMPALLQGSLFVSATGRTKGKAIVHMLMVLLIHLLMTYLLLWMTVGVLYLGVMGMWLVCIPCGVCVLIGTLISRCIS